MLFYVLMVTINSDGFIGHLMVMFIGYQKFVYHVFFLLTNLAISRSG